MATASGTQTKFLISTYVPNMWKQIQYPNFSHLVFIKNRNNNG